MSPWGGQNKGAVSLLAGKSKGESHLCVSCTCCGYWEMGRANVSGRKNREEMKEEIREGDNVVCVAVAVIQTRAGHLATLQLLREVEWWDCVLNPLLRFICLNVCSP